MAADLTLAFNIVALSRIQDTQEFAPMAPIVGATTLDLSAAIARCHPAPYLPPSQSLPSPLTMSLLCPPCRPFHSKTEEDRAEREFSKSPWEYSKWVKDEAYLKAESTIGRVHLLAALEYFDPISMAAAAEMIVELTPVFKTVDLQDAHAFFDRMATEVAAAEASPACDVTSKRRKSL